jgi:hypothetical protein
MQLEGEEWNKVLQKYNYLVFYSLQNYPSKGKTRKTQEILKESI